MSNDGDLLRRSMDAAPEQWLDRLVADRVMAEVWQQCSAPAQERSRRSRRGPLLDWLRALRALVAPLRAWIESGLGLRQNASSLRRAWAGLHEGYEDRSCSSREWAHHQSHTALRVRWPVAERATFGCLSRFLGARCGHPAAGCSLSWAGLQRRRNEGCSRPRHGVGARLPTPGPDERDRREQVANGSWQDP